jgi:hypothetical protein
MPYLNEFDIHFVVRCAEQRDDWPNTQKAAAVIARLSAWTDEHSDGWAYWQKPRLAADKLATMLNDRFLVHYPMRVSEDITDEELSKALVPVKAFITRMINGGGSDESDRAYILEGAR